MKDTSTQQLLKVEFRYKRIPRFEYDSEHATKTITIGIFHDMQQAVKVGNELLDILSKHFERRENDKFTTGGPLGANKLVTNCLYKNNGLQYFANIETLYFDEITKVIDEVFSSHSEHRNWVES